MAGATTTDDTRTSRARALEIQQKKFWIVFGSIVGSNLVGLVIFAFAASSTSATAVVGIGIMVGAASAISGGFMGFLFGLPRAGASAPGATQQPGDRPPSPPPAPVHQSDAARPPGEQQPPSQSAAAPPEQPSDAQRGSSAPPPTPPTGSNSGSRAGSANTNLQDISDWLAKLIVGAGLVEAQRLAGWVGDQGLRVGEAAGLANRTIVAGTEVVTGAAIATAFGSSIMVFNFVAGFLFVYIFTRTVISYMFATAERDVDDAMQGMERRISQQIAATVQQINPVIGVLTSLYEREPGGFERALARSGELIEQPDHLSDPELWLYRACAFGQKHAYRKRYGASPGELTALADSAYTAASRAVELDTRMRDRIKPLMDPTDPRHSPGEDDLRSLGDDERFRRLVTPN